jgi:hypothetical protein
MSKKPPPDILGDYVDAARRMLQDAEQTLVELEAIQQRVLQEDAEYFRAELEDIQRKTKALGPLRTFIDTEIGAMLSTVLDIPPSSSFRFVSNIGEENGILFYILCYTEVETDEPWRVEGGLHKPVIIEADLDSGINISNHIAKTRIRIPPDVRGGEMLRRFIADWMATAAPHHAEEIDAHLQRLEAETRPAFSGRPQAPYWRK